MRRHSERAGTWQRAIAALGLGAVACVGPIGVVAEDASGALGAMRFETVSDDCTPQRFTGDAGTLFVGAQASGRLVVATSLEAFWGPPRPDAGAIVSGSRTDFVTGAPVELLQGGDPARRCGRLRYTWSDEGLDDGGARTLLLEQVWIGVDVGCPELFPFLPGRDCTSTRRITFEPGTPCRLQCLRPSSASFTCGC
ncbi:MAG: hypothetical protein INH41_25095 [Myxococcaceae bacterium]|nr:hypothetical protein [Myxococcaceae bacterium]MCA3015678.1 hypothetical protein [Myxococcaceae bacterium]